VIAVREHGTPPAPALLSQGRVDVPGRRDLEPLHASGERPLVLGLDQQVDVAALQADMDDADPLADGGDDRGLAEGAIHLAPAQAADGGHHAQDHVQRMVRLDLGPPLVRRPGALALGLATRALALATVGEQLLLHVPLPRTPRPTRHVLSISTPIPTGKLISPI
jgi:hypothetical protein